MRLGGSESSQREGYVEGLGTNGQWGSICDNGFDIKDADVICRMLRFSYAILALASSTADDLYGEPPLENFVLSNLKCNGNEESIFTECIHPGEWSETCNKSEIAGVQCARSKLQLISSS